LPTWMATVLRVQPSPLLPKAIPANSVAYPGD